MRKADNLSPPCAMVTKSRNLNFLEPSGPLQACNETDLPLYVIAVLLVLLSKSKNNACVQHLILGISWETLRRKF